VKQAQISPALWQASDYAQHYFDRERRFVSNGLRQAVGPSTLQVGDRILKNVVDEFELPFVLKTSAGPIGDSDIVTDPAFLPFAPDSFATVILPHVLEIHDLPHQVLREAHRVLMSEGHIVVTGFNPRSVLGMQRFLNPKAVMPGRYYTPKRVVDWLQLLGFEVVASAMFQYAPLSRSQRFLAAIQFLESIGDRWLPMFGGGYMIAAKKKDVGMTMVGRVRFKSPKPNIATSPSAQARVENLKE